MKLKEELISIMCCPKCKGEVRVSNAGDGVLCEACALEYPVCDGIPVMMIGEAIKIETAK